MLFFSVATAQASERQSQFTWHGQQKTYFFQLPFNLKFHFNKLEKFYSSSSSSSSSEKLFFRVQV